jgi:hypothetical protein
VEVSRPGALQPESCSNPNFRSITTNPSTSRTSRAFTLPICFHPADHRKQDPETTSLSRSHRTKDTHLADAVPSATMPGLVTATGVLAFLADEEPELKVFALKTLNEDIDTVWFEVADALTQMYAPPRPSPDPLVVVVDLTCVFA